MIAVLTNAWALLFGLLLLMVGNGLQGTLLGVRGAVEGYDPSTMSVVMSAYFLGMLVGAWIGADLIRRVGHVRVFAALASLISAAFLIYAAIPNPLSWVLMRFLVGLCFAGIYIVTESWLNETTTNETRGQALSAYLIVQMLGIIAAQGMLNLADPSEYTLYVVISVIVSLSVAPILLSASPAPVFESAKRMTMVELYRVSPLGFVGCFIVGGMFSAMFGMSAVYSTEAGFTAAQTSLFVALIYTGGLVCQYPLGWISDRVDRRRLIAAITGFAAVVLTAGLAFGGNFVVVCVLGFVLGGVANPLYALLLAYTNDFLEREDMAAASSGLIFVAGLGAVTGPLVIGALMGWVGPAGFFAYMCALFASICLYALYRMTKRAAPSAEETGAFVPVNTQSSAVAVEWAQDYAQDLTEERAEEENPETAPLDAETQ